jgi:hypothetical protein
MTRIRIRQRYRISQGDIFREIEYIEYVAEKSGIIEVSRIVFPLVIVLTQDCDLEWDHEFRRGKKSKSQDKLLISVLVAPLYNAEQVYLGDHLSNLDMKMEFINPKKSPGEFLQKNERPRYHYLTFPPSQHLVDCIVDFKHYFSVNVQYLRRISRNNFVCRLAELDREDLSQRFASYLSRIGLPDQSISKPAPLPV